VLRDFGCSQFLVTREQALSETGDVFIDFESFAWLGYSRCAGCWSLFENEIAGTDSVAGTEDGGLG
jgi:hypothetical protein